MFRVACAMFVSAHRAGQLCAAGAFRPARCGRLPLLLVLAVTCPLIACTTPDPQSSDPPGASESAADRPADASEPRANEPSAAGDPQPQDTSPARSDDDTFPQERLGPGMARLAVQSESCTPDGDAYRCVLEVERTYRTGPQTRHPTAGSKLSVLVFPSHFRDLSPDSIRSRLEPGRRLDLTVQSRYARDDPDPSWTVVRF